MSDVDLEQALRDYLGGAAVLRRMHDPRSNLPIGQDDADRSWARFADESDKLYEIEYHWKFAVEHRDPTPYFEICELRPWPPEHPSGDTYRIVEYQRFPVSGGAEEREQLRGEG